MRRARERARADGAISVEAHHLLLALAEVPSGGAGRVMVDVALTEQAVRDALDREIAVALAAVGVHESLPGRRVPPPSRCGLPTWGQSAKLAIKRTGGRRSDGAIARSGTSTCSSQS